MAISKLQPVTTSAGGVNTTYWTIPTEKTQYRSSVNFSSGIYQVTTYPTSNVAYVDFLDANKNSIVKTQTVNGTVSVSIATTAKYIVFYSSGSSGVLMGITQTGNTGIFSGVSGTLDTITSTTTYTQTGEMLVLVIGGGGGGGGGGNGYEAGGGGSGGIDGGYCNVSGNTAITIGNGGTGASAGWGNISTSGGTTSFGTLFTATGGSGTQYTSGGSGGSPNGGQGSRSYNSGSYTPPYPAINLFQSVRAGTTGGGCSSGSQNQIVGGIGTGGSTGQAGTGYGSGGGGGGGAGGNGAQGVCYVLRNLTWV